MGAHIKGDAEIFDVGHGVLKLVELIRWAASELWALQQESL
jgi:hypothetical protein